MKINTISQTNYKRRWEGSQQALTQALQENRVHAKCLEMAMAALRQVANSKTTTWRHYAAHVLFDIRARLAELENRSWDISGE